MFREMRRKKQELSFEESEEILKKGTSGVLTVLGDEGYPYAVPLSYVYYDSKLYFHAAGDGHKIDAILRSEKVSFCVIDQDHIVPEEYTTYFRSVIVFGKARILQEEGETRQAIEQLAKKYSPEEKEEGCLEEIDKQFKRLCMIELSVDHMTGKEAIELVKEKGAHPA